MPGDESPVVIELTPEQEVGAPYWSPASLAQADVVTTKTCLDCGAQIKSPPHVECQVCGGKIE